MRFKLTILYYLILFRLRGDRYKKRSQLVRLQQKRFRNLSKKLKDSPYYRSYSEGEVTLDCYPVIDKKIFMKEFDIINTRSVKKDEAFSLAVEAEESRDFTGMISDITIGLSTGTSGNRGIFMAGSRERAMWVAAVIDRVTGFTLKPRKIAFFLRSNSNLYRSANSVLLKFYFFDLLKPHDDNFRRLQKVNADILVAQPSALRKIADSYEEHLISPSFSKVISVAEVLDITDREYLERVFGVKLDEVYQCTEGFLAASCREGKLHFNEDFLIIEKEYLSDKKEMYYPIITDLFRYTQPVVRYRLDDIIAEGNDCGCGSSFAVIEKISGRSDEIVKLFDNAGKLTDIFPDYLRRAIVLSGEEIVDYMVVQTGEMKLSVSFTCNDEKDKASLGRKIKENILKHLSLYNIASVEIEFTRYTEQKKGEKLRRIRNEYYKEVQDSRDR